MMRAAFREFMGGYDGAGLVEMLVDNIPDPLIGGARKFRNHYTGEQGSNSKLTKSVIEGGKDGSDPLLINVCKMYPSPDGTTFTALGRVYSGVVRTGEKVKVLGEVS